MSQAASQRAASAAVRQYEYGAQSSTHSVGAIEQSAGSGGGDGSGEGDASGEGDGDASGDCDGDVQRAKGSMHGSGDGDG